MPSQAQIASFLERAYQKYHSRDYLRTDPLEYVYRYRDPWDQEVAAIIASLFAYGQVGQIRKSVLGALQRMEELEGTPTRFVRRQGQSRERLEEIFADFVHRFNRGKDLAALLFAIARSWDSYGSVGGHFTKYLGKNAADVSLGLEGLIQDWEREGPIPFLLTKPSNGSCCKRWCMLLRWMGRDDEVDPGLWVRKSPLAETFSQGLGLQAGQLVMPLDTHVGRISQKLGLTTRRTLNWKAALEVTEALKRFDRKDPTRFDFALTRYGMVEGSLKEEIQV